MNLVVILCLLKETYCGDKLPPVYKSVTNMVEIAMTAVNLGKKDKGILYKFVYEVIPPRHMRQNPALISSLTSSVPSELSLYDQTLAASTVAEVKPAGSVKTPRQPKRTYQLTSKVQKPTG